MLNAWRENTLRSVSARRQARSAATLQLRSDRDYRLRGSDRAQGARLYGLPEAAPALLCGTPAPPAGQQEFAAEVGWDLPSLAPWS